jgi:hypothetical protein
MFQVEVPHILKNRFDLFKRCGGRHVPIHRCATKTHVSDSTPNHIGLVAGTMEPVYYEQDYFWGFHLVFSRVNPFLMV